ncbi:hypothetical protein ABCR94_03400 [Streptomyces sp. 21So2-11]|uniref:hypothetical protein n=1 Tax=Streptomyces sp. 21So2-11 TaxID=3144408 RepID=UPI00321C2593
MRTDRAARPARALCLLLVLLFCAGFSGAAAPVAYAVDGPIADVGPPDPEPKEWEHDTVGLTPGGKYCLVEKGNGCKMRLGEQPGTTGKCQGADGNVDPECSAADRKKFEKRRLEKWQRITDTKAENFEKVNKYITACIERGEPFEDCLRAGKDKHPLPDKGPAGWVAKQFSELAADALKEAASYIGESVVWLLERFAEVFNKSSTIDLQKTGIGSITGIMTTLSLVLATFLLLVQFAKVGISQKGEPAATAVIGLAKWAVISSVYVVATQTALGWSDAVSTWIINYTFKGGGSGEADATAAMQEQLGTLFGGLITGGGGGAVIGGALITGESVAAAAVGVIIVIGIVCILAIGCLWIEVLLRQAGIMILVATMPVVLAGQMSDATQEWWPKARNALIALILMKPMIVVAFAIGFGAMSQGKGAQNMFVGLVIFILACFAWPVLAKFMTFSTVGGGSSIASGVMSSIGSSAGSMSGGYRPEMGGAGAVGGGSGYTRALEQDAAQTAGSGSNAPGGSTFNASGASSKAAKAGGKSFGSKGGSIALPLQVLAAGKDTLESGMANTAAHAGLDHGAGGGRHVVIPPRGSGSSQAPPENDTAPAPAPASATAPAPSGAPVETPPSPLPSPPKEG